MFNYQHSALQNVIERCFGMLTTRFSILKQIPPYPFNTKIYITNVLLHNYLIHKYRLNDCQK